MLTILLGPLLGACVSGTPTAAPTPAPSALPAGTYTSVAFRPAVTYTVPAGWANTADAASYFLLQPVDSEVDGIHLFRDPLAASQDAACPSAAATGVGSTSSQLVAWMRERPGLVVSSPRIATVGGLHGVSVDIGIVAGWSASCPFANGAPTVPLITAPGAYHWVVVGNERLRLYLLDLPAGGTVAVDIDAFDGTRFDALIAAAEPIVQSFLFAP